ncbi:cytochrome P450 [Amycolatopsis sp. FDAARGOS 1241]|uniref:cytochrome P450 n=1 Tax=Amycolatopsis sp. FDAARGOS 1241 TaxID=2778070 RepID=UPI00194FA242|nr:cytochrome P450 [Amycolatopsis sp. FDAARGOS 1241]QRP43969.1 cytochrome P450 [Amycolatopsis sp. FDAARGOS 1241]
MSEPWVVTGHAEVKQLFAEPRLEPLPARDPAEHRQMRRLLTGAFSARRMAALKPGVDALAHRLLEELIPPVDFHAAFSDPFPELVIRRLLGAPPGEDLTEVARFKRGHPADDVLSDLVHEVPPEEAARHAKILLYAGHVTTTTAIDKGLVPLDTHPDQRAALWADPALAPGTVEEILRLPPKSPLIGGRPRRATADFETGGRTLRTGDLVLLSAVRANLDETVFANPTTFDIRRDARGHLAFGHGPHHCLGAPLARLELRAVFTALPRVLPGFRLAVPPSELERRFDVSHTEFAQLPVTW